MTVVTIIPGEMIDQSMTEHHFDQQQTEMRAVIILCLHGVIVIVIIQIII